MSESPYLEQIRQLIQQFHTIDQQRKAREETARQAYRKECQTAEAEFKEQQQLYETAREAAKSRYDVAYEGLQGQVKQRYEEAAQQLEQVKKAERRLHNAAERAGIAPEENDISFTPPSDNHAEPSEEFEACIASAAEMVRKLDHNIHELLRIREKRSRDIQQQHKIVLQQQQRQRQRRKILMAVLAGVLVLAIGTAGVILHRTRTLQSHYDHALTALEAQDWERARQELSQLFDLDNDYKDAQMLLKETFYRPVAAALERQQWNEARMSAKEALMIDAGYKDLQTLYRESFYQPAAIALEAGQWEEARRHAEELLEIDGEYKDTQVLLRETYYQPLVDALESHYWDEARTLSQTLYSIDPDYRDIQTLLKESLYQPMTIAFQAGELAEAYQYAEEIKSIDAAYKDIQPFTESLQEQYQKFSLDAAVIQQKILFEDGFSNNQHKWYQGSNKNKECKARIKDGKYLLESQYQGSCYITRPITIDQNEDFQIEAFMRNLEQDDACYGIVWGYKDSDQMSGLNLCGTGHYVYEHGYEQTYKETENLNGKGLVNTLTVKKFGTRIQFFINGQYASDAEFKSFYGDKVGFRVGAQAKVEVDDILITANQENAETQMQLEYAEFFPQEEKLRLHATLRLIQGDADTVWEPREVALKIGETFVTAHQTGGCFDNGGSIGELHLLGGDDVKQGWIEFAGISKELALEGCFDVFYGTLFTFKQVCMR